MEIYNITIDGPCGSGKTTIAKAVAEKLNIAYLDTGAMYRSIAYYCYKHNIDVTNDSDVKAVLGDIALELKQIDGLQHMIVNGEDITSLIRTQEISMLASTVSKIPAVRLKLVDMQRDVARSLSCVVDGRDIGSYVLPDAEFKFYLTADADERAKRRYLELKDKSNTSIEKVKAEMIARDEQDSKRAFAPLVVPKGAYVVDTTNLTFDEVLDIVLREINKK